MSEERTMEAEQRRAAKEQMIALMQAGDAGEPILLGRCRIRKYLVVTTGHPINLAICRTGSAAAKICRISSFGSAALMRCAVAYASCARASSPTTASKVAAI